MERYEIAKDKLYLIDDELGLHIEAPFFSKAKKKEQLKDAAGKLLESFFLEDDKRQGECLCYSTDGKINAKLHYLQNELHGPSVFFDRNEKLLSISWFVFGKKQGKSLRYYPSGALYCCERYLDGLPHQKQEYFYENGDAKTVIHYQKGLLEGFTRLYWENKRLKRELFFIQGKREGVERIWSQSGKLLDEEFFEKGKSVQTKRRWSEEGVLLEEVIHLALGKEEHSLWNFDGQLISEGKYQDEHNFVERKFDQNTGIWNERNGLWNGKQLIFKK